MKTVYAETILLIERLHRRFLDVIDAELERLKIDDLNNVQTLILYNIGYVELTVGELTGRGYYLGSNVSYNVKKLVENGYLVQSRSNYDKRAIRVKLSQKGLDICEKVGLLYQSHADALQKNDEGLVALSATNHLLENLEGFWTEYMAQIYKRV